MREMARLAKVRSCVPFGDVLSFLIHSGAFISTPFTGSGVGVLGIRGGDEIHVTRGVSRVLIVSENKNNLLTASDVPVLPGDGII